MACPCKYAFFVDGVPVHCCAGTPAGSHSGGGSRPVMHRLPSMPLTSATLIESFGTLEHCINCRPVDVASEKS